MRKQPRSCVSQPHYTISGVKRPINAFKYAEDYEHFVDGLRKAGLPE